MGDIVESFRRVAHPGRPPRLLGIFDASRLQAYGYAIAIIYAVSFVNGYRYGVWLIDHTGAPIYTDFTTTWVVGFQARRGDPSLLYDSADFLRIQAALIGPRAFLYPNWPYPPTFFLILAPLSMLPYAYAFLTWDVATLLCMIGVVYLIVRRAPAIAVVLASPFTAWNFLGGQNGFLTASLLGASLLLLERRPVLAGLIIGCFAYKPQFAVLFPLALAASGRWRAFASAAAATALFVCASIIAFGTSPWQAFPRGFLTQFSVVLEAGGHPDEVMEKWRLLQTVYGLVRYLHGGAPLAWAAQGIATSGAAILVWCVWRSSMRYSLKAAVLSAAALLATPYAYAYDMAALAIPVAFLARDQLGYGLLRGEQTILIALFGALLAVFVITFGNSPGAVTFGSVPSGPVAVIVVLALILRRGAK